MQDTRDSINTTRWLGWTLLVTTLCCHTAHAQEATTAAEEPAYDLRADAERDLVDDTSSSRSPSLTTNRDRLRVRRALNLELTGWMISAVSVPGLSVHLGACSRTRIGFRAPLATLSFGISSGLVGTILRIRRMRGRGRMDFGERQDLFRSPVGRGFGFAGLFIAAVAVAAIVPAVEIPLSCTD